MSGNLPFACCHSNFLSIHSLKDSVGDASKKKASSSIKILHSSLPHFIRHVDNLHVMSPPPTERAAALCLLDETSGALSLIQSTNGQQVSLLSSSQTDFSTLP